MHFCKSPRTTFSTDNYNPPPGFYLGNTDNRNTMTLIKTQYPTQQFLKQERFPQPPQANQSEYKTVDGFEKIAQRSSLKYLVAQDQKDKMNYVSQTQQLFRKQRDQTTQQKKGALNLLKQVEELLNSQLLLKLDISPPIVDNKSQELLNRLQVLAVKETPGPGAYEAKYGLVKKRIPGCIIREEGQLTQKETLSQTTDIIFGQSLTQKDSENTQQQFFKKKDKKQEQQDILDDEYNLELMFQRDQKKGGKQTIPPPGHYEIESQFGKVKQLDFRNQCFDSRAPRFRQAVNEIPGPGEYSEPEMMSNGGFISKLERKSVKQNAGGVAVGTYTVQELRKPQRKDGKFPSSFGSGSKRMPETPQVDTPGPGSYNTNKKKQKGYKYGFQMKNKREIIEQEQQQVFGLSVKHEIMKNSKPRKRSISQQKANKNQHIFASSVERFQDQGSQDKFELGPGAYDIKEEFTKGTFNKGDDLFGKSMRIKEKGLGSIGPGHYEQDSKLVQRKMVRDVHF